MSQEKYIGMDVHQTTVSAAVRDRNGNLLMECILETKADTLGRGKVLLSSYKQKAEAEYASAWLIEIHLYGVAARAASASSRPAPVASVLQQT